MFLEFQLIVNSFQNKCIKVPTICIRHYTYGLTNEAKNRNANDNTMPLLTVLWTAQQERVRETSKEIVSEVGLEGWAGQAKEKAHRRW